MQFGINYNEVSAILTRAMQEQDDEIEKLEEDNARMKAYLCKLDPNAPFCSNGK